MKIQRITVMLSRTYEAFIASGVPPAKAKKASEEIAGFGRRRIGLEVMIALTLAGTLILLVKAFLVVRPKSLQGCCKLFGL